MKSIEKMTKLELLEEVKRRDSILLENKCLHDEVQHLKKQVKECEHLAAAVQAKDLEMTQLRNEHNENKSSEVATLQGQLKFQEQVNEKLSEILNTYVDATRAYLKQAQGSLDSMLLLESYILPKPPEEKGGK